MTLPSIVAASWANSPIGTTHQYTEDNTTYWFKLNQGMAGWDYMYQKAGTSKSHGQLWDWGLVTLKKDSRSKLIAR